MAGVTKRDLDISWTLTSYLKGKVTQATGYGIKLESRLVGNFTENTTWYKMIDKN